MQRTLVTGGAGLVGSHLCDRLLAAGHEVIAVDDLSTGTYANLAHLKNEPRFALVEHDVSRPFRADVDEIFHLAVPSTRRRCDADPVGTTLTAVLGTKHVLDVASWRGARVVLVTSTERWGDGLRCAESFVQGAFAAVDVRVVRVPSTFGPRMMPDDAHIVSALALALLRGDARSEVDATHRESLAFVDDVVAVLAAVMASRDAVAPVVAPSMSLSASEVLDLLVRARARLESATSLRASAGRASAKTDEPAPRASTTPPAEAIARTLAWFEAKLAGGRSGVRASRGRFGAAGGGSTTALATPGLVAANAVSPLTSARS